MNRQILKLVVVEKYAYNHDYEIQKEAWNKAGRKAPALGLTCPNQTIETPAYRTLLNGTYEIPEGWKLASVQMFESQTRLLLERTETDSAYR